MCFSIKIMDDNPIWQTLGDAQSNIYIFDNYFQKNYIDSYWFCRKSNITTPSIFRFLAKKLYSFTKYGIIYFDKFFHIMNIKT